MPTGGWLAWFELPADRPRVYVFTLLADQNREKLHQILENTAQDRAAPKNSIRGLVGGFYRSGMDEKRIEEAGARPLQKGLTASPRCGNRGTFCPS
jgi:putative endopeptidase